MLPKLSSLVWVSNNSKISYLVDEKNKFIRTSSQQSLEWVHVMVAG